MKYNFLKVISRPLIDGFRKESLTILSNIFLIFIFLSLAISSKAAEFKLTQYETSSGAIVLFSQGDSVDPYFSTKALLAAHELGLDIDVPARKWINWLLSRQQSNGVFHRYCFNRDVWNICADADADDAMAAVWIQLLSVMSLKNTMPLLWKRSVQLSLSSLDKIHNKKGLYEISKDNPVALLMDNCEVYAGFNSYANYLRASKMPEEEHLIRQKMIKLEQAIFKEFWNSSRQHYKVSSQELTEEKFYPTHVAQLYPMLNGLKSVEPSISYDFKRWALLYGQEWLTFNKDHFPWGLIALAAYKEGAYNWVIEWMKKATVLRHTSRWNVLEEAIFQGLLFKFP